MYWFEAICQVIYVNLGLQLIQKQFVIIQSMTCFG